MDSYKPISTSSATNLYFVYQNLTFVVRTAMIMSEALVKLLLRTTPAAQLGQVKTQLEDLDGGRYEQILNSALARQILGHETSSEPGDAPKDYETWQSRLTETLNRTSYPSTEPDASTPLQIFIIGLASLNAFLQCNITGPPLPFSSGNTLIPSQLDHGQVRRKILDSLQLDGESPYKLTPNIELFWLAQTIFKTSSISSHTKAATWANMRIDFAHQRLLSELSPTLQMNIVQNIVLIKQEIEPYSLEIPDLHASFLLEIAAIHLYYADGKSAQIALAETIKLRNFQFALTGMLGKRTKFQQTDTSQLVVLAKSEEHVNATQAVPHTDSKPITVDLNDETLLDAISFTKDTSADFQVKDEDEIAESLKNLDPQKQPQLNPLDSIILLSTATSITNTAPSDGLTREETLPYATRVLEGGSSNWQVYTQALLIRSRIEGYRSRTVERGLLQLQALVDQVIADTTQPGDTTAPVPSTFLPKAKDDESAPASQRLLYIHQLASPYRWELESELAARWISLGGLKSALEIYERLELWPEVALCWAGIERDDKARQIVQKQLFEAASRPADATEDSSDVQWTGAERNPPPSDAPRLYCILGDIDKDPAMYEKAWEVSKNRYFRAQKSLGKYWYAQKEYSKAVVAFSKAVQIKQLDHATWFAMGCALLELEQYPRATEVFSRAVQLDDQDAESWSNLAVALLNQDEHPEQQSNDAPEAILDIPVTDDDDLGEENHPSDSQKHRKDALRALRHAAKLKRDSYRIWDNVLTVASTVDPPSYIDMITAQRRIIELRGSTNGEKCVDENVMALLVRHVISSTEPQASNMPGIARMVYQLLDQQVVPLITSSQRLWLLVAQLAEWRGKPEAALTAHEKAWRVVTVQPGWEHGTEKQWNAVANATVQLAEAYKLLGQMEKVEGMGAGSGELVRKDWKFKAKSAIRGILGKGKESWEGSKGWDNLQDLMQSL
jgi:tetratricopeptide (TPR) repeat protein